MYSMLLEVPLKFSDKHPAPKSWDPPPPGELLGIFAEIFKLTLFYYFFQFIYNFSAVANN